MSKIRILYLLSVVFMGLLISLPSASKPQFLVVPHIADAEPYMILNAQQQPQAGLLFELYSMLSEKLSQPLDIQPVPRKKVIDMLLQGKVDIFCNASQEWFHEKGLRWSIPLFTIRDLIVSRQYFADFDHFSREVSGSIGTTSEYVYPKLKRLFQQGQLQRVDSFSPRESIRLFEAGLLQHIVVSELELKYFLKRHSDFHVVEIQAYQIQCVYAPHLSLTQIQALDTELEHLRQQGNLINLLNKYR